MKQMLLTIIFIVFTLSATQAQFPYGDGSEVNPWLVETVEQLQSIEIHLDMHFIQIGDIDATITEDWNDGSGFNPIGDDVSPFTGTFDGGEFEITGLTIIRSDENHVGLFGFVEGGQISNTGLVDVNIKGRHAVGALAGDNQGVIRNSYSTGIILGVGWTGGLVGQNVEGEIIDSYSTVEVSDSTGYVVDVSKINSSRPIVSDNNSDFDWRDHLSGSAGSDADGNIIVSGAYTTTQISENIFIGGLVGLNFDGQITNSYATGPVIGGSSVIGGLAGANSGVITNSYATGTVTGSGNAIGGLVGSNVSGQVSASYAAGVVTGSLNVVGGLVGGNSAGMIDNSYSLGAVTGVNEIGGLVGVNTDEGVVTYSYATGFVTGEGDVGGLIGINDIDVVSSYWDVQSTGQSNGVGQGSSAGASGLATAQMTGTSVIEFMTEFDFELMWRTTDEYPALQWEDLSTSVDKHTLPVSYELKQNYPNPFNPATQISFTIPEQTHVRLEVFNALGQRVAVLVNENKNAGNYETTFNASGLSSGIYLYRLQTESFSESRQLMLLK